MTVFPGEIYRAPRSWTERAYHKLNYFNEVDKGGHFAAWRVYGGASLVVQEGAREVAPFAVHVPILLWL